jgi:hypothetical protein
MVSRDKTDFLAATQYLSRISSLRACHLPCKKKRVIDKFYLAMIWGSIQARILPPKKRKSQPKPPRFAACKGLSWRGFAKEMRGSVLSGSGETAAHR